MKLNSKVSELIKAINHPMQLEIHELRMLILETDRRFEENIKWNSPNYLVNEQDRITMRLQPAKHIQLIFHRGAKKLEQPQSRLIETESKLLQWKENDRAIITFKNADDVYKGKLELAEIIKLWINATS